MRRALLVPLALLLVALPARAQPTEHVLLSELARELQGDPRALAALDALLADMGTRPGAGAMLSPEQKARLRAALEHALRTGEVDALERAPALRVSEMGAGVAVATAAGVGVAATGGQAVGVGAPPPSARPRREPLGIPVAAAPAPAPAPGRDGPLAALGITPRGAVPDPDLAPRAADSARMADVLNRLAVNPPGKPRLIVTHGEGEAATPAELLGLLVATGHTVRVVDARMFADFAGLSAGGRDLAAPMWADTELPVPGRSTLKVPVTHSQHELVVRGPTVNVDVSFYMGIDGEARFRAMINDRASWTGRRIAHEYEGDRAVEAVRLAGEVRRSFEANRAAHPELPYGGYFALGVCNDSNAFIEHALNGRTTLYPLTRDLRYYRGDSEIDRIARAMPVDGRGAPADLERVLASLPTDDPDELVFPALRDDLRALGVGRPAPAPQQGPPQQGLKDELERAGGKRP